MNVLCLAAQLYYVALFGRIILSWFPAPREGGLATINSALYSVTEPVLGPIRRILPPLGGFDLSPLVVIFGMQIVLGALGCRIGF